MQLSPIALFVYNRPLHLQRTVASLRANGLAKDSDLFIFSDAPKDKAAESGVKSVRDYLRKIDGFKKVCIQENERNLGSSRNVIAGVTDVINRYGRIIVLEDDLVVSRYFLDFMNSALLSYEDASEIISIGGYMYPAEIKNSQTVFLRMICSWGWATWKRGWDLFDSDAGGLSRQILSRRLSKRFNLDGGRDFFKILKKQSLGKIHSWAICWYASALVNEKLSLHPARSLVQNIGFDNSGTHCGNGGRYETDMNYERINLLKMPIKEDLQATKKIEVFFRLNRLNKAKNIIFNMFRRTRPVK